MYRYLKRILMGGRERGEIDPDEIFLDAHNLPQFDRAQLEGRIEKPISKNPIRVVFGMVFLIACVFVGQLYRLQIVSGEQYAQRAENNRLRESIVFAERGLVYDRRGVPLIENVANVETTDFSLRKYTNLPGLSHVLGYIKYPAKDNNGFYHREAMKGESGIERYYNDRLSGINGEKIIETNALGEVQSENIINPPIHGEKLELSIDAQLQSYMHTAIADLAHRVGFSGGSGVIMNIHTGEVLAKTSYPEFSSQVMTDGTDRAAIAAYNTNPSAPFLDKAISGLYTPGSIIKPFMGVAVLEEGVITPEEKILSTGSIRLENPYAPGVYTVFNDWKAHGYTDLRQAIAVSSDVYFYVVGGGYENRKGIGIEKIDRYMRMFGFGMDLEDGFFKDKKGVVPNPKWKEETFNGDPWRVGNTYHTSIGQYGFQVTPIQAVRAVASLANNGWLVEPTILKDGPVVKKELPFDKKNLQIVREGMHEATVSGTVQGLKLSYVQVGGKSGTAELGVTKEQVNSWITGFFPYENPQYAFAIVMEKGQRDNLTGAVFAMRSVFDWMHTNRPEYLK